MVKALFMVLVLCGMLTQTAVAETFSAAQMSKYQVKALDFPTMLKTFYPNQQQKITLNAQAVRELGGLPYVGFKWSNEELAYVVSDERRIAVMHPVQTYKNAQKQTRYLVLIEKCLADEQGNLLSLPFAVFLGADLYVFKQTSNGYQLVTRSSEDTDFSFAHGRLLLDLPSLAKNLKPVGNHVQAKVESYRARQIFEATLIIKENQFIMIKE